MAQHSLWSLIRPRRKARNTGTSTRRPEARTARSVKPSVLALEDRILPSGSPLTYQAPADQPLRATLSVMPDAAGPRLELIDTASQAILAGQALADTSGVSIFGSNRDDTLTVDLGTPFAVPVSYTGGGHTGPARDALIVRGGVSPASYTPAAGSTDQGTIQVGGSTITFNDVQPLTVQDVPSLTFTAPGHSTDLHIDSPAAGQNRIAGTSDGTSFAPLTFYNVPNVTVDTGADETPGSASDVGIYSTDLVATGLQNFSVTAGPGTNRLTLYGSDYSLPAPGGTFTFQGGSGGSNTVIAPDATAHGTLDGNGDGTLAGQHGSSVALRGVQSLQDLSEIDPDLVGTIQGLLSGGATSTIQETGTYTLGNLQITNPTLSFQNVGYSSGSVSGTVGISADSASLTVGSAFSLVLADGQAPDSTPLPALGGTFDVSSKKLAFTVGQANLTAGSLFTGSASDFQLSYDPNQADQQLASISQMSATIIPLHNTSVTLSGLQIYTNGFTLDNATVSADAFTLGGALSITNPSLTFTNIGVMPDKNDILTQSGTIGVGGSLALFPGNGAFTGSATNFSATYDFAQGTLTAGADSLSVQFGSIVKVTTDKVQFGVDPQLQTFTLKTSASATSPVFPGATGTIDTLTITESGVSFSSFTLQPQGEITVDNILQLDGLQVTVSDFSYQSGALVGSPSIGIGVTSASLFPGQSAFSTTLTNFGGHYDFGTSTLSLSADQLTAKIGNFVKVDATTVKFTADAQDNTLSVSADSTSASSPYFAGTTVSVDSLTINQDEFQVTGVQFGPADYSAGSLLTLQGFQLKVSSFTYLTNPPAGESHVDASQTNISASVTGVDLFPNQSVVTATVKSFAGSYDAQNQVLNLSAGEVDLAVGSAVQVTATDLKFAIDPASGTFQFSGSATATSSYLPGASLTFDTLQFDNNTLSFKDVSLGPVDVNINNLLVLHQLTLDVANFTYHLDTKTVDNTTSITVNAQEVDLFPNASAFTSTVTKFTGSYDDATATFSLSADDVKLAIGQVVQIDATNVGFTFDTQKNTFNLSVGHPAEGTTPGTVGQATATSSLSSSLSATVTDLQISNAGVSFDNLTLTSDVTLGSVLNLTNFTVSVSNFSYKNGALSNNTTLTVSADSGTLFNGQTAFTASVTPDKSGESAISSTYDFGTQALSLTLKNVDVNFESGVLDFSGKDISLTLNPFEIKIGTATLTSTRFNGLTGSVQDLDITSDGFSAGAVTGGATGTVTIGSLFTFTNFSVTLTNFGYSVSSGGSFSGNIGVSADSASLTIGNSSVTVSATTVTGSVSLATGSMGDFTFSADTVDVGLKSYLTLHATTVSFDTGAVGTSNYVASFGSVSAKLGLPNSGLQLSGSGQNFAIDGNGGFHELDGFGVSFSTSGSGGSGLLDKLSWPKWLPIQISQLGLTWNGNFNTDPSNFNIDLSASLNANSFFGSNLSLSGNIDNAVIDIGLLEQGKFPITSLGGAGFSATGNLAGITVSAGFFMRVLMVDSTGAITTDPTKAVDRHLYGGIEGSVNFDGMSGAALRVGFSDMGLLDAFVQVDDTEIIDPVSGLAISNFRGGIDFGQSLPATTNPKDLASNSEFKPVDQQSVTDWENNLQAAVLNEVANQDNPADFYSSFIIQGGATVFDAYATQGAFTGDVDVLLDSTGKIVLEGNFKFGGTASLNADIYLDLSQVAAGTATILVHGTFPATNPLATLDGSIVFQFGTHTQLPAGPVTGNLSQALTFTITVNGELDLQLPAFKAVTFTVLGTSTFQVSQPANPADPTVLELTLSGQLGFSAGPLHGSLLGVAGDMHLEFDHDGQGNVTGAKTWGALAMQPGNLSQKLASYGLTVTGIGLFEFNSTDTTQNVTLLVPGQAQAETFALAPTTVCIYVNGSISFDIPTTTTQLFHVDGKLTAIFAADDNNNILLDALLDGTVVIGPSSNPFFTLTVDAFLQIGTVKTGNSTATGIAGELHGTLAEGKALTNLNIGNIGGSFTLDLNTYAQDITFSVPAALQQYSTDAADQGSSITIPGTPPRGSSMQSYLSIQGSVDAKVLGGFELTGNLSVLVTATTFALHFGPDGNNDPNFLLKVADVTLLSYTAQGDLLIDATNHTIVGAIKLTVASGTGDSTSSHGLSFGGNATFFLEINSTGQDHQFAQFIVNGNPLTVPGIAPGQTVPGPYGLVYATGDLTLQIPNTSTKLTLASGTFDIEATSTSLSLMANATANLGPLGSFAIGGSLEILDNETDKGIVGSLLVQLNSGALNLPGSTSFTGEMEVLVNTTQHPQQVPGFTVSQSTGSIVSNSQLSVAQGISVLAGGDLSLGGAFDLTGQFGFTVGTTSASVSVAANVSVFGLGLTVNGSAAIYNNDPTYGSGMVIDLSLSVGGSSAISFDFSQLTITGTFVLEINSTLQTAGADSIPANTYEIAINNASVSLLGFTATGSLTLGVQDGSPTISINDLSLDFFGITTLHFTGYFTDTSFSVTAGGKVSVGDDSIGASGSFSVTLSSSGFSASVSAEGHALGISVGASGSMYIDSSSVILSVTFSAAGISYTFTETLGTVGKPINRPKVTSLSVADTTAPSQSRFLEGDTLTATAAASLASGSSSGLTYAWVVYPVADPSNILAQASAAANATSFPFTPELAGDYNVQLTVTNPANGSSVTRVTTVTVLEAPLVLTVQDSEGNVLANQTTINLNEAQGLSMTVYGHAAEPSTVETNLGFTYTWTVSKDGNQIDNATGSNSTLALDSLIPGTYTVVVSAEDSRQNAATSAFTVIVTNLPPRITSLTGPNQIVANTSPVTYTATATDPGGTDDTLTYRWTVHDSAGNDITPAGTHTGTSFTYTPTAQGTQLITVTVTDSYDASVSKSTSLSVVGSTIVVSNPFDTFDETGSPTLGTLRDAIQTANLAISNGAYLHENIVFASASGIQLTTADTSLGSAFDATGFTALVIKGDVTIDGTPGGIATLGVGISVQRGSGPMRLFFVDQGARVTLKDLNLTGGVAQASNGHSGIGGAIWNTGDLTLISDTLYNNSAIGSGGEEGKGGAVLNDGMGSLVVTNCTFSGNTATGGGPTGGALENLGTATINASTFSNNTAPGGNGGSIFNTGITNSLTLNNSILAVSASVLAAMTADGGSRIPDFWTESTAHLSGSANLIESTNFNTTTLQAPANFAPWSDDPQLLPLANYGGYTPTCALPSGSAFASVGSVSTSPLTDQRGAPRGNSPSIGAYQPIATWVVDSNQDVIFNNQDWTKTNWFNDPQDPTMTLTRAVNLANYSPGPQTITFAPTLAGATITMMFDHASVGIASGIPGDFVATPVEAVLGIRGNVTIDGSAAPGLTIAGEGPMSGIQLFFVAPGATLTVENVTLANSSALGYLAGTTAYFDVTDLEGATVTQGAAAALGGAILNIGTTNVVGVTFTGNSATGQPPGFDGPGTANDPGAGGFGGAIFNAAGAVLNITNSTFTNNTATGGAGAADLQTGKPDPTRGVAGNGDGGAIANFRGTVTIINSTFANNSAVAGQGATNGTAAGADIYNFDPGPQYTGVSAGPSTVSLVNTILASSSGGPALFNSDAGVVSGTNNLIGSASHNVPTAAYSTANPLLDPNGLQDNGGLTETIALQSRSPAIDAGTTNGAPATDQRGQARFGPPDIGAYEYIPGSGGSGALPTVAIQDISQYEGDSGLTLFRFTVTLSVPVPGLTIDYTVTDGTAVLGKDYFATNGSLVFDGNVTQLFISVWAVADTVGGPDRTFIVSLTPHSHADAAEVTISRSHALGTILNDDAVVTVTSLADGTGLPGAITLRDAVNLFNEPTFLSLHKAATIQFAPGLAGRAIDLSTAADTTVDNSALVVDGDLTIIGDPKLGMTLDTATTGSPMRLFYVAPGASLALKNLTLEGGMAQGGAGQSSTAGEAGGGGAGLGGAILNRGALDLENDSFTGNKAVGGSGGNSSTGFSGPAGQGGSPFGGSGGSGATGPGGGSGAGSSAHGIGGGAGASVNFPGLTVGGGGGGGAGLGGAIFNDQGATLTISNSTFTANKVIGGAGGQVVDSVSVFNGQPGSALGAGIFNNGGTITIADSVFRNNVMEVPNSLTGSPAIADGGGVYNYQGQLTLSYTTMADNVIGPIGTDPDLVNNGGTVMPGAAGVTNRIGSTSPDLQDSTFISSDATPVAVASVPATVVQGTTFALDGSTSVALHGIALYEWDLNYDGQTFHPTVTSTSPLASATLGSVGTHTIALRVTDSTGAQSAVAETTISITNVAPTVTLLAPPTTGFGGVPVHIAATAVDPGAAPDSLGVVGDALTFQWTILKGNQTWLTVTDVQSAANLTISQTGAVVTDVLTFTPDAVTGTSSDIYHVYLTVTDQTGAADAQLNVIPAGAVNATPITADHVDVSVSPGTPPVTTGSAPAISTVTVFLQGTALAAPYAVQEGQLLNFSAVAVSSDQLPLTYVWSFGDGTVLNGASLNHQYTQAGTYTVDLKVSDLNGTTEQTIQVSVTAIPLNPTLGGALQVNEDSVYTLVLSANPQAPSVSSWTINWGDNAAEQTIIGNPPAVTHLYTDGSPNSVTITASATNQDGTVNANSLTVAVIPVPPTVSISGAGEVSEGTPYTLNLSASSLPEDPITGWTIQWGDGQSNTLTGNPTSAVHTYADGGKAYTVIASATTDDGSFAAPSLAVQVDLVAPTIQLDGLAVAVVDTPYALTTLSASDPDNDAIASWTIAWGDGDTVNIQGIPTTADLTHVYSVSGLYTITATATDVDGTTASATLPVEAVSFALTTSTSQVNEGDTLTVNLASTDPAQLQIPGGTIAWGDNSSDPIPAGATSLTHVYKQEGVYVLMATFPQDSGSVSSNPLTVLVQPVAPTVAISGADQTAEGSTYTLNLSATNFAGAPTSVSGWTITWGDGQTDIIQGSPATVTHIYGQAGQTYTVQAIATSPNGLANATEDGLISSAEQNSLHSVANPLTVTVNNVDPSLSVAGNQTIAEGAALSLPALGTISDPGFATGQILPELFTYTVNWGDGTAVGTGTAAQVNGGPNVPTSASFGGAHTYGEAGVYVVSVMVADGNGGSSTGSFQVTVTPVNPVLTLVGAQQINLGQTLDLPKLGVFTDASFSLPNQPETFSYSLDWGDGSSDTSGPVSGVMMGSPGQLTTGGFGGSHLYAAPGAYTVTATVTDSQGASASGKLTVQVGKVDVDPEVISSSAVSTYGQAINFSTTVTALASGLPVPTGSVSFYDGTTLLDTEALDATGHATSKSLSSLGAGFHQITVTYSGDTNFAGTTSPSMVQTVRKAHLSVKADDQTMVYGAAQPTLTANISGFVNGDTAASSGMSGASLLTTVPANSHAGSYAIVTQPGNLSAANYDFLPAYCSNGTLTITPAALTITPDSKTMTYGGKLPALTASYRGLVNGDTAAAIEGLTLSTVAANSHAGSYAINASGATDGDYTIRYVPGPLTITPAALTIAADSKVMTYGGKLPMLTATFLGLVNGDTSSAVTGLTLSTVPASSHAGRYAITPSGASDSDYTISYTNGTLRINAAMLTISADNKTMPYGGSLPALTASYNGLVNGDSSTVVKGLVLATVPASSTVGNYAITASGASDADYAITYVPGTLTITPVALTISADNKTMVYGSSALPALTASYSRLVNGDTSASLTTPAVLSTTATVTSPVGDYPISVSGATDPNYLITFVPGTLTITKDPTTTTATASTNQANFGQTETFNVTVTANAPGSGTPDGSVDFFDTQTSTDLGSVALSGGTASLSTATLTSGKHTISFTYSGSSNYQTSSTTVLVTILPSVFILDPTASGALTLSDNATMNILGVVQVDSSSASAVSLSGNASLTASGIEIVGGDRISGNASFHPGPDTGAAFAADPFKGLPVPPSSDLSVEGAVHVSGNSKLTIDPGIYSAISISGNGELTMNAGTYIITGGGFSVTGNGRVSGSGVFLYNAGSAYPSAGGSFGSINLSGNGTIDLTPPNTGTYAGILIFQARDNNRALTLSGDALSLPPGGLIYAPAAQVRISGNGQFQGALVADALNVSGNSIFNQVTGAGAIVCTPAQIRTALSQILDQFDAQFGRTTSGPTLHQQDGAAESFTEFPAMVLGGVTRQSVTLAPSWLPLVSANDSVPLVPGASLVNDMLFGGPQLFDGTENAAGAPGLIDLLAENLAADALANGGNVALFGEDDSFGSSGD